jgi:hypothetical protein
MYRRDHVMSGHQNIHSPWLYPAITAKQHRALWIMLQGAAIGLMLGIVTRAMWDLGIAASVAMALRDLGIATWSMLQDAADACGDFLRFVSSQRGS